MNEIVTQNKVEFNYTEDVEGLDLETLAQNL